MSEKSVAVLVHLKFDGTKLIGTLGCSTVKVSNPSATFFTTHDPEAQLNHTAIHSDSS